MWEVLLPRSALLRASRPPTLLCNFGTIIGLPSRSPSGEGWFETALKKRLLTMRC
jgi:hypothetical protein